MDSVAWIVAQSFLKSRLPLEIIQLIHEQTRTRPVLCCSTCGETVLTDCDEFAFEGGLSVPYSVLDVLDKKWIVTNKGFRLLMRGDDNVCVPTIDLTHPTVCLSTPTPYVFRCVTGSEWYHVHNRFTRLMQVMPYFRMGDLVVCGVCHFRIKRLKKSWSTWVDCV